MIKLDVPKMHCDGCARTVTRALLSVDSKAKIETDFDTRHVQLETSADASALLAVLEEAGYPATVA